MTSPDSKAAFGRAGERHARLYLEAREYRFVAANWRCRAGELDLVMRDGSELAFIEVKTRTGDWGGHASEAVTSVKASRVLDAAEAFVAAHPEFEDDVWRCDIIAVTLGRDAVVRSLEHFVNAIYED